jgi:hypothetical protein
MPFLVKRDVEKVEWMSCINGCPWKSRSWPENEDIVAGIYFHFKTLISILEKCWKDLWRLLGWVQEVLGWKQWMHIGWWPLFFHDRSIIGNKERPATVLDSLVSLTERKEKKNTHGLPKLGPNCGMWARMH